jgi:hypothetical protein
MHRRPAPPPNAFSPTPFLQRLFRWALRVAACVRGRWSTTPRRREAARRCEEEAARHSQFRARPLPKSLDQRTVAEAVRYQRVSERGWLIRPYLDTGVFCGSYHPDEQVERQRSAVAPTTTAHAPQLAHTEQRLRARRQFDERAAARRAAEVTEERTPTTHSRPPALPPARSRPAGDRPSDDLC